MVTDRVTRKRLKAIDRIYARLPTIACRGKCQESCGPIYMSLRCPMLCRESGKCRVYDIRPVICRLWGLVESMLCPWGCRPARVLTDREGAVIIERVMRIGNEEVSC
jgi:uncharacterized protein